MKTRATSDDAASAIVAATAQDGAGSAQGERALGMARAFAEPLLAGRLLDTGEEAWSHAQGVAEILRGIGAAPAMQAAAYLVYAGDFLQRPQETVAKAFGDSYASLVELTRRLVAVQRAARDAEVQASDRARQTERVRKMLLAFSRDLRVVLLRLASRLQTLRWHAASRRECPPALALESRQVFAPLASRLGIWQIKWELEDLAFRFLQPQDYRHIARLLDETRSARELGIEFVRHQLAGVLRQAGLEAQVQGRPKHLYSIWKKMQGKGLAFDHVFDLRALRVIVDDVSACYAALSAVHARYRALSEEYDDYIARPKANGYQSLHTVVRADDGRPVEVQIRSQAMHEHAEHGVAAHWAYKEAGARGYAGASADAESAARMAQARRAVMGQLLAWERDFASGGGGDVGPLAGAGAPATGAAGMAAGAGKGEGSGEAGAASVDRIYVLTPQSTVVELVSGATPVDFAYALHTELGHRCRGAKVDGVMVPLGTCLRNGQTVEIISAKEGGPSLDWLNPELGLLHSPRARAKVRAWFNAQAQHQTIARGRELVEKLLQREGRTAMRLDELAVRLGFRHAEALFEVVGKDEMSLRQIESLLRPPVEPAAPSAEEAVSLQRPRAADAGVLVVGIDSLMTTLARCCRPVPPDAIGGFVTRDKGVAVHRADCGNFRHMAQASPGRVIAVDWGGTASVGNGSRHGPQRPVYPVDLAIEAQDRQGLLRDISEVFTRERVNVTGVHTRSVRDAGGGTAHMHFTVEVDDASRLGPVLRTVAQVSGVRSARRR
jgi:GTP pyrophosphokinase